ncbi:dihydrofolate reductase family protein [Nocardia farcinica]|uniref:dihydrofolate reductase family protein n=1 Tax=Nocardia farcinica TaxID=37329 RepID=UPI003CC7D5AA
MSLDGHLDDVGPERLRLSDAADFDRVDRVRAESDAILVGAQTLRRDDPGRGGGRPGRGGGRRGGGGPPPPRPVRTRVAIRRTRRSTRPTAPTSRSSIRARRPCPSWGSCARRSRCSSARSCSARSASCSA